MSIKIIGVGMPRTGSKSLQLALHKLGFQETYHMHSAFAAYRDDPENNGDWDFWLDAYKKAIEARKKGEIADIDFEKVFSKKPVGSSAERFVATVDAPGLLLWRELLKRYPAAVLLLHERDADKWYESVMATVYQVGKAQVDLGNPTDPIHQFHSYWWGVHSPFEDKMEDRDFVKSKYHEFNQAIKESISKEKVCVFEVKEGWKPLCDFLRVAIPDEEFPRANGREEFLARAKELQEKKYLNP